MRRVLLYCSLLIANCSLCQNLVPNYSFEDTLQCIQGWNQVQGYVANWGGGSSGLSYFTSLCNESKDSVPLNWWGYQYPHTGKAYTGIYTYVSDSCKTCLIYSKNDRDYLQVQLIDSLKKNVRYYTTFYVCPADTSWFYCNDIGVYFSDSALYYSSGITYVKSYLTPQIANDPVKNPLTKAKTWIKISGSFIAQGGEKYLIIGNFKNDSLSSIIYKGEISTTEPDAFYYVDDVFVTTDSLLAEASEVKIKSELVKLYPNPNNGKFTIESSVVSEKWSIEIYNTLGQQVYKSPLNSAANELDLSPNAKGLYFYRVLTETGMLISEGKLIIQ